MTNELKNLDCGQLSETRHFYYNSSWQLLEERMETGGEISAYAFKQNVWGVRYIDDLMFRDGDGDDDPQTGNLGLNGSGLDLRQYFLQDPNWNVVAWCNTSGSALYRFSYSAYGRFTPLSSVFVPVESLSGHDFAFTGRQYDEETGLYHYRMRSYGADLGRFLSRDPVGYFLPDMADTGHNGNGFGDPTVRNANRRLNTAGRVSNAGFLVSNINDFNLYRYCHNEPLTLTDPNGEFAPIIAVIVIGVYIFWGDNPANAPGPNDPTYPANPDAGLVPAAIAGAGAGAVGALGRCACAAAGGAGTGALGVGSTAVVTPGLGAGTYPALLINGTVYVARFHAVALELAGGAGVAGSCTKYGMAIIDASGKVIGWK